MLSRLYGRFRRNASESSKHCAKPTPSDSTRSRYLLNRYVCPRIGNSLLPSLQSSSSGSIQDPYSYIPRALAFFLWPPPLLLEMCRLVIYKGTSPVQLSHLLTRPCHSIINQAFDSRLRLDHRRPINGDGFGVGEPLPAVVGSCASFPLTTTSNT